MSKQPKRGASTRLPRGEKLSPPEAHIADSFPAQYNYYAAPSSTYSSSTLLNSVDSNYRSQPGLAFNTAPATIPQGKVAIPALKSTHSSSSGKTFKKGRTAHACDSCRKAKAGCTGGQPCSRCKTTKSSCMYSDGKRDREKKEMTKLSEDAISHRHLVRHYHEVMSDIRQIREDESLTVEGMRDGLDKVLNMTMDAASPDEAYESPDQDEDADIDVDVQEELGDDMMDQHRHLSPTMANMIPHHHQYQHQDDYFEPHGVDMLQLQGHQQASRINTWRDVFDVHQSHDSSIHQHQNQYSQQVTRESNLHNPSTEMELMRPMTDRGAVAIGPRNMNVNIGMAGTGHNTSNRGSISGPQGGDGRFGPGLGEETVDVDAQISYDDSQINDQHNLEQHIQRHGSF